MLKRALSVVIGLCGIAGFGGAFFQPAAQAADLTELEQKWLTAAWPVIVYAKALQLPLDIIVQPEMKANDVPLAMGYDNGRCKLVLSLRNNPQAEATLAGIEPSRHRLLIETMAAHEVGHCWRYAQGKWHTLPAGFDKARDRPVANAAANAAATAATTAQNKSPAIREERNEEAFADLFGLAWVLQFHPEQYPQVYAWLQTQRSDPSLPGSSHDTLAWVKLAQDRKHFEPAPSLFEQATKLWRQGLRDEEVN